MLSEAETKHKKGILNALQKEAGEIKKNLATLNAEKENWFSKKSDIGKKIQDIIAQVKENKDKRNELTKNVKFKKQERQKFNTAVKEQVEKLKVAKEVKEKSFKDAGVKGNPYRLEQEIEKLEFKIMTEPMGFSQEQAIMKEIKAKKKQLNSLQSVRSASSDFKTITRDVNKTRKTADKVHRELKESAKKSQEYHEKILALSEQIDKLKLEEDESHKHFVELKEKYLVVQKELKEKQSEINIVKQDLMKHNVVIKEESKKKEIAKVKAKQKQVEQKVRNGGKLTTEDLLAFQANVGKKEEKEKRNQEFKSKSKQKTPTSPALSEKTLHIQEEKE